ncbi:sugar phosphate isomerase/epimerase family protein [Paenibacillus sp. GCM10023252]|uniref:sugar phosphate isomerase/epimerase family protein n=1 Tax=Paenibacillus sp. GCM10023252 TaxID=3252649 RepID=UPI00361A2F62
MKIGIADYGLNVWDGGCYDSEERWLKLKRIGYAGIERLSVWGAEEALRGASLLRRMGMDYATVRCPSPELSIQWTAALGKGYVWTAAAADWDMDTVCRQINRQAEACKRWGIRVAHHNHMGTSVETEEQLEQLLERSPACKLILDVAHLAAAGGDCVEIVKKYGDRIEVIHVKDWFSVSESEPVWSERGRFCILGEGNIGLDVVEVLRQAEMAGFDGWVFVEQDEHQADPFQELAASRAYLRRAGY